MKANYMLFPSHLFSRLNRTNTIIFIQSLNATSRLGLTDKLLSNLNMNLIRKFFLHKKETTMICQKVFRNMSQKRYKFQHLGRISIALTYFPAEWKVYGLL